MPEGPKRDSLGRDREVRREVREMDQVESLVDTG